MKVFEDIISIVLSCAEEAFLQVGVFVGAVLLIFGYINYKHNGKFIEGIEKSKRLQPIIGALLGLSPGCGGAILVMPLFIKGSISFGTVVATLIATMGDSAFVMIAAMPLAYLWLSVLSFIIAIVTGYIIDYFQIGKNLIKQRKSKSEEELKEIHLKYKNVKTEYQLSNPQQGKIHIGHQEGDEIDIALHHNNKSIINVKAHRFTHGIGYKIFWVITVIGLILGILLLFQVDVNNQLLFPNLGSIVGIAGTIFSVVYMIISKKTIKDDSHDEVESKMLSLKETFIHNANETAFVNTWVFAAYLIYEIIVYLIGGEAVVQGWLMSTGILSIVIGACIGLIPGCGPQIIFVALYTKGFIPFAALLANAISQDGDALFPLIAMDKKSSLWATIFTTIPAFVFAFIYYLIEMKIFGTY